jgi:hypothetical protein
MVLDIGSGLTFEPVASAGLKAWRRPQRFAWLDQVGAVPIADTELLNLAHHCPIAIHVGGGAPTVVCLLRAELLRAARVGKDGRWLLAYQPLALRTLPFRARNVAGERLVEVSRELAESPEGGDPVSMFTKAGQPSRDYATVLSLLDVMARGRERLADAARLLIAADLLVPLEGPAAGNGLMIVSSELLFELSGARAGALAADGCMPFDLAAACLFSQRWLAEGLIGQRRPVDIETVPVARESLLDHGLQGALDHPLALDDSALFSFEAFVAAGGTDERT